MVASAADFSLRIEELGLRALPAGITLEEMRRARARGATNVAGADPARAAVRRFAAVAPAMLRDLVPLCRRVGPDLIVHEEAEMAGPVAARVVGVPNVNHSWPSPVIPAAQAAMVEEETAHLWRESSLDPEPAGGRYRHLHVDTCPPALQSQADAAALPLQLLRPVTVDAPGVVGAPRWLDRLAGAPTVYVTLGTVALFNATVSLFAAALEGLRDEGMEVVAAVWENNDPAALGPQPPNVHVERAVPQSVVLPHVDVAVVHGGPGSTVAALAEGVPLLVVPPPAPIFDRVAGAVVRAGVGRRLSPSDAGPDAFRREVRLLMEEPRYREAAARVRAEIDGMPTPAQVVPVLERLASA
jgi:UDP:flavonoid glycosyltransferase YjiC (YdhE family)